MGRATSGDLGPPARPQVCGVLGRPDPQTLRRLLDGAPDSLMRVVDEPCLLVAATPRGLHRWRYGAGEGWTWGATARDRTPTGWQDAARRTGAAGFWRDGPTGGIHTDQLALQDVYVRELGDATYFSTELEQLFTLDDAPLTPDPAAWAACLAFGAPFGATTPVTQVRRLTPGAAVTVAADGRTRGASTEPFWAGLSDAPPTPAELAERLAAAVPGGPDPAVVALSGGWDSRVLARLALRRGQPLEAWTTYQYHPQERDVQLAGPVAQALGIPHQLVLPRGRNWARQLSVVRRRTAHQTWRHAWLHPLARDLRAHGLPVYDGLLGDVLLRANLAQRTARSPDLADGLVTSLTGKRLRRLDERASGAFADALAELLREVTDPVAGHPNAPTVGQLLVRQTRAIGASPGRVFGPEIDVVTPFAHPDVVAGALAVPLAEKKESAYYLELLSLVCGPEGGLPSTNDPRLRKRTKADSFLGLPLIEALAAPVRDSPTVLALLEPEIREVLRDPARLPELRRQPGTVGVLAWAALLADWQQRHGARLDWSGWPG